MDVRRSPFPSKWFLKHNCCLGHKKFLLRYIIFHYKVAVQCVVSSYQIILPLLFWRWERLLDYSHISSVRCLACNLCCTRTTDISINNWQQQIPARQFTITLEYKYLWLLYYVCLTTSQILRFVGMWYSNFMWSHLKSKVYHESWFIYFNRSIKN